MKKKAPPGVIAGKFRLEEPGEGSLIVTVLNKDNMMKITSTIFLVFWMMTFTACGSDDSDSQGIPGDGETSEEQGEDTGEEEAPDVYLPADEPGPYMPAAVAVTFYDESRDRELPGTIWYPTNAQTGDEMLYQGLLPLGDAITNVPIADGVFPLLAFSHGHQAFDAQSYFLTEYLATHGYVIVACDHIEDTTATSEPEYTAKSALDRPQDVLFMIDTALQWNEEEGHLLKGHLDAENIGITGHSFGAYTTFASLGPAVDFEDFVRRCNEMDESEWDGPWRFCEELNDSDISYVEDCKPCSFYDSRIKAAVPMCPAARKVFLEGEIAKIDVPILIMAGEKDTTTPVTDEVYPFFEETTHPGTMYWELKNAGHFTFSNMCLILNDPDFGCGDDFIEAERAWELINTATTAFFGIYLKQEERYKSYFEADYMATAPEVLLEKKEAR